MENIRGNRMIINIEKMGLKLLINGSNEVPLWFDIDNNGNSFLFTHNTMSAIKVPVMLEDYEAEIELDLPMYIDPKIIQDIYKLSRGGLVNIDMVDNCTIRYGNRTFVNEIIEPKFIKQQVMNVLEIPIKGEVVFKNELTLAARTLTFSNFKSPIVSIVKANNCLYMHMQEGTYEVLTSLINLPHQRETNDE